MALTLSKILMGIPDQQWQQWYHTPAMVQVSSLVPQHQAHASCAARARSRYLQGCSNG